MQNGDVLAAYADIDGLEHDFGFQPRTHPQRVFPVGQVGIKT